MTDDEQMSLNNDRLEVVVGEMDGLKIQYKSLPFYARNRRKKMEARWSELNSERVSLFFRNQRLYLANESDPIIQAQVRRVMP